jgi:FixJ family two-component response regulator
LAEALSENLLMSGLRKIVAVVDADSDERAATVKILSSFGYGSETFDSAEAFLKAAAASKATCLVVDIQLPDISGVELAYQLAADRFEHPVIFTASLDDETFRRNAIAAGGVAYLRKPFPGQLLIEAIIRSMFKDGPLCSGSENK